MSELEDLKKYYDLKTKPCANNCCFAHDVCAKYNCGRYKYPEIYCNMYVTKPPNKPIVEFFCGIPLDKKEA